MQAHQNTHRGTRTRLASAALFALGVLFGTAAQAGLLVAQHEQVGGSITTLAQADALIASTAPTPAAAVYSVINFSDHPTIGHFGGDAPWPNSDGADPNSERNNTFAAKVTGFVHITSAGTYTFGTNNDDGVRLRVDGVTLISDSSLHPAADFFGSISLSAGVHSIDLVFFENAGGADLELFAASGSFSSFNSSFRLLGAPDGLQTSVVPEPASVALLGLGLAGLGWGRRRRDA